MPTNRSLLVLGLTLVSSLSLLRLPEPHQRALADSARSSLLTAGQWLFSRATHHAQSQQKARFLLTQNVELALDNMRLREAAWENLRLRRALNFRRRVGAPAVIPAEVIGRDPDQLYDTIVIDAGRGAGVAQDCAVVTAAGLVGHVSSVDEHSSVVQLIMRSSVSALVQSSRAQGIVSWVRGNRFRLRFVETGSRVQEGDRVVSSGLGGRYPKGIPIGVLVEVRTEQRNPLFQEVYLESSVDFLHLEEVFVVRPAPS
ncbi:MAG: rod shape-determining protein MreC [Candidatus Latescibacterota bacterium]